MSLTRRFKKFNNINLKNFVKLYILDNLVGYVNKNLASKITNYFKDNFNLTSERLILEKIKNNELNFNSLTAFFKDIAILCLKLNLIPKINQENINVTSINNLINSPILFEIDRSLISLFGIKAEGVHLNGYVVSNNNIYLWIAKRSSKKLLCPNKLDNIVAGAISVGYTPLSTLIKESLEEASLPQELSNKAKLIDKIHYLYPYKGGIRNDIMYIYSLALPVSFIPVAYDKEVANFYLLKVDIVLDILENSSKFKFNSGIATIDFLLKKEIINNNNTSNYTLKKIKKYLENMKIN